MYLCVQIHSGCDDHMLFAQIVVREIAMTRSVEVDGEMAVDREMARLAEVDGEMAKLAEVDEEMFRSAEVDRRSLEMD